MEEERITVGEDVEKLEPFHISGRNGNGSFSVENNLVVHQKLKHRITIWPRNSTLYIQKASEIRTQTNTCTHKFIAALSTIAKKKKQLKYSAPEEWVNKWQHTHTMK